MINRLRVVGTKVKATSDSLAAFEVGRPKVDLLENGI